MPLRLKSLELNGYKTFASRTMFQFADHVTAIVGPNGSGKSNVADSIRWVLGEQSYSLLRGKKTEDMIFAGSEMRPRAGMASASIVFDNSDGWLPIDFSEVAITRRAYRDGENEYLLNGQRVRLRDVSELLAQSGLAERTYTIIGQGLVDAALALKAEERRRLFEEAAGIGLHRSRREESLRRLETTRRNLERVQDILAELSPRLKSLERQARRAIEYDQVKADLRVVLREWYGYHWHFAQRELTEAREAVRQREGNLEKIRVEQLALTEKLNVAREKIQELRVRLGLHHRDLAQYHNQRESAARELAVLDERERSLQEAEKNTLEERSRIEEELGYAQDRLEKAAEEVTRRQGELDEARVEAEAARKEFAARQARRRTAESAAVSARQSLGALNSRQAHLQARISERNSTLSRQESSLANLDNTIAAADGELASAEKKANQAAMELEKARTQRQEVEDRSAEQSRQISEADAKRRQQAEARSTTGAEAARLRAKLEVIVQAEESLAGYGSGAKFLVAEAQQQRVSRLKGMLTGQIEVQPEMETAVAAALGEYLDAVVFDSRQGLLGALDVLETAASRAAMLPLDHLHLPSFADLAPDEGFTPGEILGRAFELIETSQDIRPAVNLLLGNAWVACDRKAAIRLVDYLRSLDTHLPSDLRVVTLKGEVFYASGTVIAGQENRAATLSRPRQLREAKKALSDAEKQVSRLDQDVKEMDELVRKLRLEGEKLSQQVKETRRIEDAARVSHAQADLAVEKARRQKDFHQDQRKRLEEEIQKARLDVEESSRELHTLEQNIQSAREEVRSANAALSELVLDDIQEKVSHWNARLNVAERSLAEAVSLRLERKAAIDRIERAQKSLELRLHEYRASVDGLVKDRANLRDSEAEVTQQIDDLRLVIEPLEVELAGAEKDQESLQAVEADGRQTLSNAEHFSSQAKILLARRQEALQNLRGRIEDDFGLVNFEFKDEISGQTPLPLDGMVEELPTVVELNPEVEETIRRQRTLLRRMGPVNPDALTEYQEVKERFEFLTEQVADLNRAEEDIKEVIGELDLLMEREFSRTFDAVAHEFKAIFTRLFNGGSARLVLTDPDNLTDTGIDIEARLPGRRTQGLSLLSGGERSLTAASLVFALLKVSPTPFCLLDEVDAMLDESNVARFREMLRELSENTQFVVVTHNRNTVQAAEIIYGVTMGADTASQVLSLKLDQVKEIVE